MPSDILYSPELVIDWMFQGALLILLLYNLLLYAQTGKNFNLSYACYLFFISLNFFNVKLGIVSSQLPSDLSQDLAIKFETYYFEAPMYIAYFFFMRHYLESEEVFPRIDRLLKLMIANSSLEIILTNLFFYLGWYESLYVMVMGLKITNMCCAILLIPHFYKAYNRLIKYLFVGGMSLLIGTILYFLSLQLASSSEWIYWQPYYFIYLGVLVEILVFSLGIGYRFKLIQDEKILIRNKLIAELQTKEAYESKIRLQMNQELRDQADQIRQQANAMYQARLSQELSETKLQLLSARMNPHFLFNSLNSLKGLILQRKNAANYIDKFALLLRSILMQSGAATIRLSDEITTLKNYMDLENLRFNNTIEYTMIVHPGIDQQYVHLPPLLLQPLVENAIWHGLRPKKIGVKKLLIQFHQSGEVLEITIKDNGVGRKASAIYRSHKSMAMDLIKKRLRILNMDMEEGHATLKVIDELKENGTPAGTTVNLSLFVGD